MSQLAGDTSQNPIEEPVGLRGYRTVDPERSAERRREILHAAARVFAAMEYHIATMDDIARAIGVTKGVIYYHFRSKEDVYFEIVHTAIGGALRRIEGIAAEHEPAIQTLRAAISDLLEFNLNDEEEGYYAMLIIHSVKSLSPETRSRVGALQRAYGRAFTGIVRRGIAEGALIDREPVVMALTMMNAVNTVSDWFRPKGRFSMAEVIDQVADQLINGVGRPDLQRT